jgi:flagellar hook-associated protein 1 FlgK
MSLFSSINSTTDALSAQSRAIDIAGQNMANVNNPDYARQRVNYSNGADVLTSDGSESTGLTATVVQMRDALLDKQVTRELSTSASLTAQQSALERAQAALGEGVDSTDSTSAASSATSSGISTATDDFFNAFSSFAANPTDSGDREALVQAAGTLTDRMNSVDTDLSQVQTDLNTQVTSDVTSVNGLLQQIATLNGQIGRFELNAPGSAVDLRDQREAAIEQLSGKLSINTQEDASGQVQVTAKDTSGAAVVLVNLATVSGAVAFDGTKITGGASGATLALSGGSIQGELTARDGAVKTLRANLDNLAKQLVTSVNSAYNPSNTAGGNFFNASGLTAGTIQVDSHVTAAGLQASNGGAAGDNTVATAVAALASKKFSVSGGDQIDGSFSDFLTTSVGQLGQSLATTNSQVTNQNTVEQLVKSQRDAVSGVSLDEETADLLQYQRAFQASSRVFTTIDNLLDVVINQMGH